MADKNIYVVIQLGSKQFLVKEGDKIVAEKVEIKDGETLSVKEVLLSYDGSKTTIGDPYIAGASVELTADGVEKGEKVRVAKFKAKSRFRRVTGHRQLESHFTVKAIKI